MLNFTNGQTNGQTSVYFSKCVPSTVPLISGCKTYSAADSNSVDTSALKCAECESGKYPINFFTIDGGNQIPNGCVSSSFPSNDEKCRLFTYASTEDQIFCKTCTTTNYQVLNFTNGQTSVSFSKCVPSTVPLISGCKTYSAADSNSVDTSALKCAECESPKVLLNFKGDQVNEIFTKCVDSTVTLISGCSTYFAKDTGSVNINALQCVGCNR